MTMQTEEEARSETVYGRLVRLRVEPHNVAALIFGADAKVLNDHSHGLTRRNQALAAARSPATRYAEFEQEFQGESVHLFVGVHPVRAKSASFLLVLLGFGVNDERREIAAAFRLYPSSPDEQARLLDDPCFALTTLLARYGAEYDIERGERSLFEPLVDFERGRFVMYERVELPEVTEALGFDSNPKAISLVTLIRVRKDGGVRLCFPMIFRTDVYLVDVEAARR